MKYSKIALIGMMGSGKTTVSKILAEKLNINVFDSDEIFVEKFGEIKKYFADFNESSFREKESSILSETAKNERFVLSCGGGIILPESNRKVLFNGDIFTIYLKASPDTIFKRIQNNNSRPLLETDDKLKSIDKILSEREKYYSLADLTIETDFKNPEEIANEIVENLKNDLKIISSENKVSEIVIQKGICNNIEKYFNDKKYFLITNTTLKKLYPEFIAKFDKNRVVVIKDGEKYKNIKTFNYITEKLLSQKIERKDCIVAFGGGVIGDMAGFVASSVLRGVELIQIPTTLLAMVDSSIGGKTGFNSKTGKNLIGSFYFASRVLIDTNFLKTLNEYEFKCGLGEIVKYAFIEKSCKCSEDFNLIEYLKNMDSIKNNIDKIIEICVKLKVNTVNLDSHESGLRKILNFGHTFAHPLETLSNYKKFSHGEAVAYGIRYAVKLSYNLKKIDTDYFNLINQTLDNLGLATKKLKYPPKKIVALMQNDKKVINQKINLLLPTSPAVVELFDNIDSLSTEACLL